MNLDLESLKQEDLNYLKNLNVQGIFQELVAKLIQVRPEGEENVKKFMIYELKKMMANNKAEFFTDDDFETIYSFFDIFNEEDIAISYLFRALDTIDCVYDIPSVILKYKLPEDTKTINKKTFMKILKREYSKMVTLIPNV